MFSGLTWAAAKLFLGAKLKSAGSNAVHDFGALFAWLGRRTPLELIGFVFAGLFVWQHFGLVHTRHALASCQSSSAGMSQQLKASHANEVLLRRQLDDQNKRVQALSDKSTAEQHAFEKAKKPAQDRAAVAKAVSQRLAEQARHAPPIRPNCPNPEPLKPTWP